MKRIDKEDIKYIIALTCFFAICVVRFWDKKIVDTNHIFSFLYDKRVGELVTVLFFITIVGFSFFILKRSMANTKKSIYYLLTTFIVLIVPIYLCDDYFGTGDVYSWIIVMVAIMISLCSNLDWMVVVLIVVATIVCPLHNFAGISILVVIMFYKGLVKNKKIDTAFAIISTVLFVASNIVLYILGHYSGVNVYRVSLTKFIATIVLLSPIIVFAVKYMLELIKIKNISLKLVYVSALLCGIVDFVLLTLVGDYSRAIVLTMSYFVMLIIVFLDLQEESFLEVYFRAKDAINKYVPIPVAVIIYIFAIVTYWYFAKDFIDTESIIELKM